MSISRVIRYSSAAPADSSAAGSSVTCRRTASRTPRDRHQAAGRVVPGHRGRRQSGRRPASARCLPGRRPRHRSRLQLRQRYGRDGLHRGQPGRMHDLGPHQHPPADRGQDEGVKRHFYSSSACVYNVDLQQVSEVTALREEDAYPALPEDGYGWRSSSRSGCAGTSRTTTESRRAWRGTTTSTGLTWTYDGGREGTGGDLPQGRPGEAVSRHEIEIWGDGEQTAASCTSTIASTARCGSWRATSST